MANMAYTAKQEDAVVAIYATHNAAEKAVKELQKSGVDMKKLSIVGQDYHSEEDVVGFYNAGDRMKFWGKLGAFWGGLWGILFGSAFLLVPGFGQVVVLGPLVSWIANGVAGAALGAGFSALGAGLFSIGIPKNSVINYETALKAEKFVVVLHGAADEILRARDVMGKGAESVDVHENVQTKTKTA